MVRMKGKARGQGEEEVWRRERDEIAREIGRKERRMVNRREEGF